MDFVYITSKYIYKRTNMGSRYNYKLDYIHLEKNSDATTLCGYRYMHGSLHVLSYREETKAKITKTDKNYTRMYVSACASDSVYAIDSLQLFKHSTSPSYSINNNRRVKNTHTFLCKHLFCLAVALRYSKHHHFSIWKMNQNPKNGK